MKPDNFFTKNLGIKVPVICGAMYPCSNPELVAAVSENGGIGVIQPLSLVYVYSYEFRAGIQKIRSLTHKPIGMNVIVEKNIKAYENRMKNWVDIALEEGIKFFITALGDPSWVIEKVKSYGGYVFHDVTDRKWAEKVIEKGVDGFICVNNRAGGHAGIQTAEDIYRQISPLGLPLVCAGGIGTAEEFEKVMGIGYQGVQMGTRFIATPECRAHQDYKDAIVHASEKDIVLTERVTGVPLSVIRTDYVEKVGLKVGPLSRFLFRFRKTRHWLRSLYNIRAVRSMKRSNLKGLTTKDYYQAGKSVAGISSIESVQTILRDFLKVFQALK